MDTFSETGSFEGLATFSYPQEGQETAPLLEECFSMALVEVHRLSTSPKLTKSQDVETRTAGPRVTGDLSVRWSVRAPRSMVQHVKTLAVARKQPPSRLVQEALRHWLAGQ